MSLIGRSFSIIWFLTKIIIAGTCGAGITAAIVVALTAIAKGSLNIEAAGLPAGLIGGTISGYFWGKLFGKLEYKKHVQMMKDVGVEVIDKK